MPILATIPARFDCACTLASLALLTASLCLGLRCSGRTTRTHQMTGFSTFFGTSCRSERSLLKCDQCFHILDMLAALDCHVFHHLSLPCRPELASDGESLEGWRQLTEKCEPEMRARFTGQLMSTLSFSISGPKGPRPRKNTSAPTPHQKRNKKRKKQKRTKKQEKSSMLTSGEERRQEREQLLGWTERGSKPDAGSHRDAPLGSSLSSAFGKVDQYEEECRLFFSLDQVHKKRPTESQHMVVFLFVVNVGISPGCRE